MSFSQLGDGQEFREGEYPSVRITQSVAYVILLETGLKLRVLQYKPGKHEEKRVSSASGIIEAILSSSLELFTLNNTEHLSLESQQEEKQVMVPFPSRPVLMSVYVLTRNLI